MSELPTQRSGAYGGRATRGFHAVAAVLLAAVLAGMLNYLSARHYARVDVSHLQFYQLSDKTRLLLGALSNRVEVTVLFDLQHQSFEDADNLLKEYEQASAHVRVERIDPVRDVARATERARQLEVTEGNVVVFSSEGRRVVVRAADLVNMDHTPALRGEPSEVVAFKGEQAFSSALQKVAAARRPVVYFLKGHGERDLADRDPRTGYSQLKRELEADNLDVRTLDVGDHPVLPADAEAVVIAAPRRRLAAPLVEQLRTYLARDGRLLVLLESGGDTGLEALFEEWGIGVGRRVAVDPARTLSGYDLFVSDFRPHPVTRALAGSTCVFYLPRVVEPLPPPGGEQADRPRAQSLCQSSPESWAESDQDQRPMRYDANRDTPGPVSLAVAAERSGVRTLDVSVQTTRLVVMGDADFAGNGPASGANYDLVLAALNWLVDREDQMAIAPKAVQEMRLVMDAAQLQWLFWAVVAGLPAAVGVVGLLVWWRRRS